MASLRQAFAATNTALRPWASRLLCFAGAAGKSCGPRSGECAVPKFAANLSMMFNEVDFLDRFDAAAGRVQGRRVPFPYDYPPEVIAEKLEKNS